MAVAGRDDDHRGVLAVLPVALALVLAALPVVVVPVTLAAKGSHPAARAFPVGWFAGLFVAGGLLLLLAEVVTFSGGGGGPWIAYLRIAVGVVLVVLGLRKWLARGEAETPAWMAGLSEMPARKAFGLAFLVASVNPKNLVVVVAAASVIADVTTLPVEELLALVVFALVGTLGVAAPALATAVLGERAAPALAAVDGWMTRHATALVAVVLVALGIYVAAKGFGAL